MADQKSLNIWATRPQKVVWAAVAVSVSVSSSSGTVISWVRISTWMLWGAGLRLSVRDTASAVASISSRLFTSPVYSSQVSSMMSQMLDLASLIWLAVLMVLAVLRRTAARPSRVCLVPLSRVEDVYKRQAQECIEDYLTFDAGHPGDVHFALRVRGESMLNAGILPGDLVVVRQQQTCNQGEIVVAMIDDEATVKRFSRKNGHVWLLPENDAYAPIDGTYAQILGKVVAVVRQY